MVSLKDYARETGVTYEAVRQQVKRYQNDLEGHIHQQGRTQYLDDAGVAILDSHRSPKPLVVSDGGLVRRNEELEAENKTLREELTESYKEQNQLLRQLGEMQGVQARLDAAETARLALAEARDEFKALADQRAEEAEQARQEADRLRADLERQIEEERAAREAAEAELDEIRRMPFLKRLFWKGE